MWGIIGIIVVAALALPPLVLWFGRERSISERRLLFGVVVVTAILIVQTVLVVYAVRERAPPPDWTAPWVLANFGFAILIGLLVGATELIARFRDEPFAPLLSAPGSFYILINGGASALAYYLLFLLAPTIGEPLRTFTAGVAAMAFFRSALFNVRLGGVDVPVGPNLILLTILKALDRTYDRQRASPRSTIVRRIVGDLSFEAIKNSLPAICFELMQNLSSEETTAITTQITDLSQSTSMDDKAKVLSLGLALLNLVGETTLQAAVDTLGSSAKAFRKVDSNLLVQLGLSEPEVVLETLPKICAALYDATPHDVDSPPFVAPPLPSELSSDSRVVLMAYKLVNYYGSELVSVAANLVETSAGAGPTLTSPSPSPSPPDQGTD